MKQLLFFSFVLSAAFVGCSDLRADQGDEWGPYYCGDSPCEPEA